MTKNIALGVLGALVLILGIIGINKYKKNNSIDLGLGFGNIGIGSGEYKGTGGGIDIGGGGSSGGKTKKGQFLKCTQYSDDLSSTIYVEFRNNKFYKMVQYKIDATIPANYMNEHTKKEIEAELARYFTCANDQDYALCGNLKFKWNNRNLTMTFGVDMSPLRDEIRDTTKDYFEMSIDEFWDYVKNENTQCEKVSKAPMYATKADPKGTYYNKYSKYKEEKKYEVSTKSSKDIEDKKAESNASAKKVIQSNQKVANDSVSNISVKKADANKTTTSTVTKKCTKENLMIKAEPINVNSETSSIRVTVTNISKQTCKIDEISMTLKDKNGKFVMNLPVYVGETIKAGETRKTTSGTDADLFRVDSSKTIYTIK